MDGFTGWVLHAIKIASENKPESRLAVERTLAAFGDPLATVRDLGSSVAKTVAAVHQRGIPDPLCHYHFLAAVGKRLLDEDHAKLRGQLGRSRRYHPNSGPDHEHSTSQCAQNRSVLKES